MHFETDTRSLDNNFLVFSMLSFVKEPGDVFITQSNMMELFAIQLMTFSSVLVV